jgi:hypothetical protein
MGLILIVGLLLVFGLSSSTGGSTGGSSSGGKSSHKETVVYHPPPSQQQPTIIYQQPPPQQQPAVIYQQPLSQDNQQKLQTKASNSPIRNFAVKSYDKIAKDSQKGSGEHLNSLILLMESEGIPKDEALPLIKRALRKSNGNAEAFGNEIENSF